MIPRLLTLIALSLCSLTSAAPVGTLKLTLEDTATNELFFALERAPAGTAEFVEVQRIDTPNGADTGSVSMVVEIDSAEAKNAYVFRVAAGNYFTDYFGYAGYSPELTVNYAHWTPIDGVPLRLELNVDGVVINAKSITVNQVP